MIHKTKTLVGANEHLQRALSVETDGRKVLHNKFEDHKWKIRVYV